MSLNTAQKVSEFDQEIPQSHTADQSQGIMRKSHSTLTVIRLSTLGILHNLCFSGEIRRHVINYSPSSFRIPGESRCAVLLVEGIMQS